jgi:predicted Fe-Mo cluster-binding NifX family protein
MKIVVTAKGAGLGAWVDDTFAGCRQVVTFYEGGRFEAISNPYADKEDGIELAKFIVDSIQPDRIVTSSMKAEALKVFTEHGIRIDFAQKGSVMELAEAAANGTLAS